MGSSHAKNERDCGVTSLEPVGRDKNSGFCEPRQWEQRRPKEALRYSDQARSNICPRAKSWNYFSASYLPDHKRKKKRNKYSL